MENTEKRLKQNLGLRMKFLSSIIGSKRGKMKNDEIMDSLSLEKL